jgi:hypothetical protein
MTRPTDCQTCYPGGTLCESGIGVHTFLDQQRGLSPSTVTMRRAHLLHFLAWFDQQRRLVNDVSVR